MEGWLEFIFVFITSYVLCICISGIFLTKIKSNNFSYNNYNSIKILSLFDLSIFSLTISSLSRGINRSRGKFLIWVYNINNLLLVKGAPFKTKTECAALLHINRRSVAVYLDSDKLFKNELIFSSTALSKEQLSKWMISPKVLEIITGELLGDGYIKYNPQNTPQINGRLEFTFSAKNLQYLNYLKYEALAFICNDSKPTPWPNPKFRYKELTPTQYWFSSKCLPFISKLHSIWYKEINGRYIKVLPLNIENILTPIGLAHWIMGDGYFTNGIVKICTDNFTQKEVLKLIEVLDKKLGIKSTINKRINPNGNIVWRIRISKLSMEKLIKLVASYFIPEMLYKLGIKK